MKKYYLTLLFLGFSVITHAQKIKYLVKPTLELDGVSPFREGMAIIQKGGLSTYITNKGKQITPFQYFEAYDFYNGLATVSFNSSLEFINKKGEKVGISNDVRKNITSGLRWIDEEMNASFIDTIDHELAIWEKDKDSYYIQRPPEIVSGISSENMPNTVSVSEYESSRKLERGLYAVQKKGKWGVIDKDGKIVVPIEYLWMEEFTEGLAAVKLMKEILDEKTNTIKKVIKMGFVDYQGNIAIPIIYDATFSFSDGLAKVVLNHKSGFVDKTGKIIIPLIYDWGSDRFDKYGLIPISINKKFGVINKLGQTVVPFQYDDCTVYYNTSGSDKKTISNLYTWVKLNDKWGGIDINGKIIIPIEFDYPGYEESGLVRMFKNGKLGYLDYRGETVVNYTFGMEDYFESGLIKIKKGNKQGIADKTEKVIIPLDNVYTYIGALSENLIHVKLNDNSHKIIRWDGNEKTEFETKSYYTGLGKLYWVLKDNLWGALNKRGDLVIPFEYDEIGPTDDIASKVLIRKNNKMGLVDTLGKIITPIKFDNIRPHNEDLLSANQNGFWGAINLKGDTVIPFEYKDVYILSKAQNIIRVTKGDKFTYFNRKGKEIPIFSYASSNFSDDLAWARKGSKLGFIDKTGKNIIPFEYEWAYNFTNGLAWTQKNGKRRFIDKTGKEVISLESKDEDPFSDGLARVYRNDKYCSFIDTTGKIVLNLPYDHALSFSEGLAWVKKDNKWGCVDKTGKIIIPIQFDDTPEDSYYFSEGLVWVKLNGKWGIIQNPLSKKQK